MELYSICPFVPGLFGDRGQWKMWSHCLILRGDEKDLEIAVIIGQDYGCN